MTNTMHGLQRFSEEEKQELADAVEQLSKGLHRSIFQDNFRCLPLSRGTIEKSNDSEVVTLGGQDEFVSLDRLSGGQKRDVGVDLVGEKFEEPGAPGWWIIRSTRFQP